MNRSLTIFGRFLLILAAVCCTMGALISAFSFNVDIRALYPMWIIAALALSVSASFFRGKGILILALPLLVFLIWKLPGILAGAKWAVCFITTEYNKWLYVPVIFRGAYATQTELSLFFTMMGIILAYLLAIAICLQSSAYLTVFFTAPFVALTVVLIESTPDMRFFLGLLAVYLTLIISGSMHPDNFIKRGRDVFPALALAMILLGVAYLVATPKNYMRGERVDNIDNYLRNTAERIGMEINKKGDGWPYLSGEWRFNTEKVAISNAGSRTITDKSILKVTASQEGTFYLRGFSMESFNGREWRDSSDTHPLSAETLQNGWPAMIADMYGRYYPAGKPAVVSMTVDRTGDSSDIIYRPYYSLPLSQSQSDPYTVDFYFVEGSILGLYDALTADELSLVSLPVDDKSVLPVYTQIEKSTSEGLLQLALDAGIDPDAGRAEVADKVAEYISSSARYTLTPYVIPDGEDFALHFLNTSKRGYCIHFATAAVLMLRALEIPARFTSGFVVTVPEGSAGKTIVVTDRDAHAWVEVYYDGVGWIPLEVTPAAPGFGIPDGTPHSINVSAPGTSTAQTDPDDDTEPPEFPEDVDKPGVAGVEDTEAPSQTSGQEGAQPEQPDGQNDRNTMKAAVKVLLAISIAAVCLFAIILCRTLVEKQRNKRFSQPDTNAAVLCAWRYISRLYRRDDPPEDIEELAAKARFSQHRITEEERAAMIDETQKLAAAMYEKQNPLIRLWQKYIRGL